MKKKIIIWLIVLIVFTLCSCSKVDSLNEDIEEIRLNGVPTQATFDEVLERYNSLSDEEKEKIEKPHVLEKYKNVDLDNIIDLQKDIDSVSSTDYFSDLVAVKERVNQLSKKEQDIIKTVNLDEAMKLNDVEKATLSAAKNVKSVMKNQASFKILEATVKDDTKDGKGFYWVLIDYTGQNSFGAMNDSTSCFSISANFTDPFWPLAVLTGVGDYLDSTVAYMEFFNSKSPEIEVDIEKINYFLHEQ